MTDSKELARSEMGSVFHEITLTQDESGSDQPQTEMESTRFGQIVAAATEILSDHSRPCEVLWLHSDFLKCCWDAPRDLVSVEWSDDELLEPLDDAARVALETMPAEQRLAELPNTFETTDVPKIELGKSDHPDLIITWMRTYACQVRLIDELLAVLIDSVCAALGCDSDALSIVVASTGGFSLGQNGFIGRRQGPLRSCHVHLPLVVSGGAPLRFPMVTSSAALPEILHRQHSGETLVDSDSWSTPFDEFDPTVTTQCQDGTIAKTCHRWFMVDDQAAMPQLFLKPDDLNDTNDVARLRPSVVGNLTE